MSLPKAIDYHRIDKRKVPNGVGIFYVLFSAVSLFMLHYFGVEEALSLASCILIGGFLGLMDDWIDIPWRFKAFLPLIAALPLITLRQGETTMATYFFGKIDFGIFYYVVIVPLIVMVVANSVNMLGGLHGLETVPPLLILLGLAISSSKWFLLATPISVLFLLAVGNCKGKFFVGNVGSFSIGITIASFGVIGNIEQMMAFSLLPYIFNSIVILASYFFLHEKAGLILLDDGNLTSHSRRSLLTLIAHDRRVSEKRMLYEVSLLVLFTTYIAYRMA